MGQEPPKAPFITFYSFKGGVGRSMALINTAAILAGQRGFRVLVIDLDLEAPGLSYLNPEAPEQPPSEQLSLMHPPQLGFVDLIADAKERGPEADLFALSAREIADRYTQTYRLPDQDREFTDGTLHIMPVGKLDADYAKRLDSLDLRTLYGHGLGEPLLRVFKKRLAEAGLYDYVLVDSRTGFSDEAGICTRDLADHLMILSGLNRQNVEGTCSFLKALRQATGGKKTFQIIVSPVPNGEDTLLDDRERRARALFQEAWGSQINLSLKIPYHPQLSLTEEPHVFRRRRGYLFEAYRKIEQRLLGELGHDARALQRKIRETLQRKEYVEALRELQRLVRFDGGKRALSHLANYLESVDRSALRDETKAELGQEKPTLDKILDDENGRRVIEFIVDNVPLDESWVVRRLLDRPENSNVDLVERLHQRIILDAPKDADNLVDYADFLSTRRGDLDRAETYYKRAIEAEPTKSHLLRIYTQFLESHRGNVDSVDPYYKRAIEAEPTNPHLLSNYAQFLDTHRGDLDGAETYYKRAIEAEPTNPHFLSTYAQFLDTHRVDMDRAEAYFKRAIEANPRKLGIHLNYGQMLAGLGRLTEGEEALLHALDRIEEFSPGERAELCFSLWLVLRMQGKDAARFERHFKFLIQRGFKRYPWTFDRMLDQAARKLPPEDLEYAKALAAAFLDESKVSDLEKYERWRTLDPLDPKTSGSSGTKTL